VAADYKSIAEKPMPDFGDAGVDIVMTHGPPKGVLDVVDGENEGCDMLLKAVGRARPLMHCFGHIHEGHGAQVVKWGREGELVGKGSEMVVSYPEAIKVDVKSGEETLMVNGAIKDGRAQPNNAPWLVDLDLPQA
jgi:hypothetical protein